MHACMEYLIAQIALIQPKIICTLGRVALQALVNPTTSITATHGNAMKWKGMILVPMYHPAAALHRATLRPSLTEDFQKLSNLLRREGIVI